MKCLLLATMYIVPYKTDHYIVRLYKQNTLVLHSKTLKENLLVKLKM